MGTGNILRGGEGARGRGGGGGRGSVPAMDQHPVQGEVTILLGMLHATGIGISAPPLPFYVCLGENSTVALHKILRLPS